MSTKQNAPNALNTVKDFEIINHGIEWPDYFQGCGVFCTEYGHVTTGIGYSVKEALDDALEMMAQSHSNIDFDDLEKRIVEEYGEIPEEITVKPEDYLPEGIDPEEYDGELPWHHISIRYNL